MKKTDETSHKELLKKMSKIKMSALRGQNDQKSNVELGRDLDLYIVSEIVGQGLPLLTPKGATIKREIERFITDEELKRGYLHTSTPVMAKSDLYKVSGHWQHYQDSMFSLKVGNEILALRPMTCPFHFILYKRKPRTYKDLPLKYAEIASLFRNEQSGELRGLTRVRQFTLADAHLICKPDQLEDEFKEVLNLINFVMSKFGIKDIWYRFSKWDSKDKEKYIDNPKAWEQSQNTMKRILDKLKIKYTEAEGEAAFYGPKLDIQYKDVYGKEDTLITVQIDFALPERFDLTYIDENGKEKRPMIIHRSSSGATERVIAYLLEKTQGKLPLWLSPVQVKILAMNESLIPYSKEVFSALIKNNIRVELDQSNETLGKKIRNAQMEKVPYMIILGDKEKEIEKISIRKRNGKSENNINLKDFIESIKKEISERLVEE
jgi:threonyl-tRNA synthetase